MQTTVQRPPTPGMREVQLPLPNGPWATLRVPEGMTEEESRPLLSYLMEHGNRPEFTCRFRWEPGSIAFWDNRATCHLVPTDVPPGMHRSMQRITLAGDLPVGPDGQPSHSLSGDSFS